jgi:hypothetical protein
MFITQISTTEEDIHMSNKQKVSIKVDGADVIGEITYRSEGDIGVKITFPYHELSNRQHIPYFSRPFNSFLTEYGDRTAENLLKHLYELGLYMEENRKFIKMQFTLHFHAAETSDMDKRDRFFGSTFPFTVPIGTREEVLRQLI